MSTPSPTSSRALVRFERPWPRRRVRRGLVCLAAAVAMVAGSCTPDEGPPDDDAPAEDASEDDATAGVPTEETEGGSPSDGVVDLVREFSPQTVAVEIAAQQQGQTVQGAGSGVIWSSDGVIVTNHHVVAPAGEIVVVLADGTRYPAELIASDQRTDIAMLQVEATGIPAAEFADELPEIGQLAVAIGNPLGFRNSATAGIVSGVERSLPVTPGQPPLVGLIQTDAAISSGNSGGALVGADGTAIGINVAAVEGTQTPGIAQGLGFAIPATTVTSVAEQLLETGEVRHTFLGIVGAGLTPPLAERFGIERDRGVLVGEVQPGSPADDAGLQQGDVIVALEGDAIADLGQLLAALREFSPGDEVTIEFVRDGDEQTTDAVLAELPDEDPFGEPEQP